MSLLLLHSGERPLVDWQFLSDTLSPGLTFERASSASRITSSGNVESLAQNVARLDYNPTTGEPLGLLYEEQRTNKLTYGWRIGSWSDNNSVSATNNALTAPDGTLTASEIVTDATSRGRYRITTGLTESTFYAISGFVKGISGSNRIRLGAETTEDTTGQGFIDINTTTGERYISATKTYDKYSVLLPNGWVYFRYYVKTGAAQTSLVYLAYSITTGATYSVWGAQIEELDATPTKRASSTILTDGSSVTRAADQLSFTIPGGVSTLRAMFDDGSTQDIAVSPGAYTLPTTLNRQRLRRIVSL